jgi:hypothetical protein
MVYKIFHGLAILFGLMLLPQTKDTFARPIIVLQIAAIGSALLGYFVSLAMIVFAISTLLIVLYAFIRMRHSAQRMVVLLIAVPDLFVLAHAMNHWPGARLFALLMIIPVLVYAFVVLRDRASFKNELGFLTILFFSSVSTFVHTVGEVISTPE